MKASAFMVLAAFVTVMPGCRSPGKERPAGNGLEQAQTLFLLGQYSGALEAFDRAGRTKDRPEAELYAAICLLKLDRPEAARERLERLALRKLEAGLTVRLLLALCRAHAELGNAGPSLDAARAAERQALRTPGRAPEDEVLFGVGSAYLRAGRTEEGRRRLERLIREHPSSSLAALAELRLKLVGFGVRVGRPLAPGDKSPRIGSLKSRSVRIDLEGRAPVAYAVLDGFSSLQEACRIARRLRRKGWAAEILP